MGSEPATTSAGTPQAVDFEDEVVRAERIDRYLLLEPIGVGGMGRVYRAIDPDLERPVAIKALRRRDPRLVARLRREAQALAQLHSPNVVDVYDVIVRDDTLFIAMELVRGVTLSSWMRQSTRWRERLEVLLQAGEGVVAAHKAGLLHRDLKPSNVLVGDDGRVRVMDFGLVLGVASSRSGDRATPDIHDPFADTRLTDHEHVIGTLAYMAPEQHSGEADERSDQFAFCVTAFEILHGVRPFPGGTRKQQLAAKKSGDIWQPMDSDVPVAVHRTIVRGLAADPDARWPSMEALLAELRRVSARRRRWWLLTVAAGLLALTSVGWWALASAETCSDERLAGVWDDARREQAKAAFIGSGSPHAEPTWDRVERELDAYAQLWIAARTEACTRDDRELDAHMRCLAQRRTELDALVDTMSEADAIVVDHAVSAVEGLMPTDACAEETAREDADPITARMADTLRGELARAKSLGDAGKLAGGLDLALSVRARALTLGDPRLLAEAHLRVAHLQRALLLFEDAAESFRAAYFAARRIDASDLAAEAAIALVGTVGRELGQYEQAETWAEHARVEVERLGDGKAEVQLELAEGMLHNERGAYEVALAHYERARASAERLPDADKLVGTTLNSIGAAQYRAGRYDAALASLQEALVKIGPQEPAAASVLTNLGGTHAALGDERAAIEHYERALVIREAALGPKHPSLAATLINLGTVYYSLRRDEDALAQYRRALDLLASKDEVPPGELGPLLNNLGMVTNSLGDHDSALAYHERALVVYETAYGPDHPEVAVTLMLLGAELGDIGEHARAIERLEQAREKIERSLGADHPRNSEALHEIGRLQLERGNADAAVETLERALAQRIALGVDADSTRFQLARALWAAGGDRSRAMSLARDARQGFAEALPVTQTSVTRIDAWIAERVNAP